MARSLFSYLRVSDCWEKLLTSVNWLVPRAPTGDKSLTLEAMALVTPSLGFKPNQSITNQYFCCWLMMRESGDGMMMIPERELTCTKILLVIVTKQHWVEAGRMNVRK